MKITNKHRLPHELVVAVESDPYSRGDADISATELIDSPRIRIMKQRFGDKVSADVSEMIAPLLGQAFHKIMEENANPDVIVEQRLFGEVNGWTLSGAIDRVVPPERKNGVPMIEDFKVTSVYTAMNPREEWASQLNVYRWLYKVNYGVMPRARIVALCRDWRPMEVKTKPGYPKTPILYIPVPSWHPAKVKNYVAQRIALHQDAQSAYDKYGIMPECSTEDRWAEPERYALMRKGRRTAVKLYDSLIEAMDAMSRMSVPHYIQVRPGGQRRCEGYCAFAGKCDQYQKIEEDRVMEKVETEILRCADERKKIT